MRKTIAYAALLGFLVGAAGCGTRGMTEGKYQGDSVLLAIEQQKLNPQAGGTDPVSGMDGNYVESVVKTHKRGPDGNSGGGKKKPSILDQLLKLGGK